MELDAEVMAKFNIGMDSIANSQKKLADYMYRLAATQYAPVTARIPFGGACNGAGFGIFGIDIGPAMGSFWYILSCAVSGGVPGTAVAGARADLYVSAANPGAGATTLATVASTLGTSDWTDQYAALPNIAFYGRGQMPLRLNEQLFVVVSGAPANQPITCAIRIEEYQEHLMDRLP